MARIKLSLISLFVIACAPVPRLAVEHTRQRAVRPPLIVSIDDRLSLRHKALFYSAAEEWRIASGGALVSIVDMSGSVAVNSWTGSSKHIKHKHDGVLLLDTSKPDDGFRHHAMHELGHEFGLPHMAEGLMSEHAVTGCIDSLTLRVACEVYECLGREKETCDG